MTPVQGLSARNMLDMCTTVSDANSPAPREPCLGGPPSYGSHRKHSGAKLLRLAGLMHSATAERWTTTAGINFGVHSRF